MCFTYSRQRGGGGGGGGCIIKMGRVYNHFLLEIRMATYVCQVLHLPPIELFLFKAVTNISCLRAEKTSLNM